MFLTLTDPDLLNPSSEIGPTLVGLAVMGPKDNLAGIVDAVVIGVVLANGEQSTGQAHVMPGGLGHRNQVRMTTAGHNGGRLKSPKNDIARLQKIPSIVRMKGDIEGVLGGLEFVERRKT